MSTPRRLRYCHEMAPSSKVVARLEATGVASAYTAGLLARLGGPSSAMSCARRRDLPICCRRAGALGEVLDTTYCNDIGPRTTTFSPPPRCGRQSPRAALGKRLAQRTGRRCSRRVSARRLPTSFRPSSMGTARQRNLRSQLPRARFQTPGFPSTPSSCPARRPGEILCVISVDSPKPASAADAELETRSSRSPVRRTQLQIAQKTGRLRASPRMLERGPGFRPG